MAALASQGEQNLSLIGTSAPGRKRAEGLHFRCQSAGFGGARQRWKTITEFHMGTGLWTGPIACGEAMHEVIGQIAVFQRLVETSTDLLAYLQTLK